MRWKSTSTLAVVLAVTAAATASAIPAMTDWSAWKNIEDVPGTSSEINTAAHDGCPIQSPDGKSLFIATNRPGGPGLLDIWVATRESTDEPFGAPQPLPAPINSAADDFCPTPVRGDRLFFVSRRQTSESCGMGDIYLTRNNPEHGWSEPRHLACAPDGPNSHLDEQGPSYFEVDGGAQLYFSRSAQGTPGEIFASERPDGGSFGPATAVAELNSAGNDIQPNVRRDGREVVLASNRTHPDAKGSLDIYSATRDSVDDEWSTPRNLGIPVNTSEAESRPSLSWDARTLLFGRAPAAGGPGDIFLSTREKQKG